MLILQQRAAPTGIVGRTLNQQKKGETTLWEGWMDPVFVASEPSVMTAGKDEGGGNLIIFERFGS